MRRKTIGMLLAGCLAFTAQISGHDEGHNAPNALPSIGPHSGRYAKLSKHFAEIVVSGETVTVYILEPDVKFVAEDATQVTLAAEIPGKGRTVLALSPAGNGYSAAFKIPASARRVTFHVSCVLDGKKESGTIIFEPKR